jgi:phenylalanyl-tRNA synthetase alpha chain
MADWQSELQAVRARWEGAVAGAGDVTALRSLEVAALGKQGEVTGLVKRTGSLLPEERRDYGAAVGELRGLVQGLIDARRQDIEQALVAAELADRTFDVTRPAPAHRTGHAHPLAQVQTEVEDVFHSMGFHVLDYPEVESEFSNFESLNIPSWHPAREMQDTFWLTNGQLLRTHTSSGQVRAMHQFPAPFRAVFPGRVFRYEATDASHEHTFHQIEGLMVDRRVGVHHLLDSMRTLLRAILRDDALEVRLRPGYFPFVEPGFELDVRCRICLGTGRSGDGGCSVCKQRGWLELLPCGLVHPNVLRAGGLDPNEWQGWAFGLGLSRLVMMRYGVPDVRLILGGDLRFLQQF